MVKLDVSLLRFMEDEDFRVLTALEMAMRNHDVAPTALVERIAQLPHGGCRKRLNTLLKHKMIHHENTMYDGYAMKYGAYDYLALRTFCKRGTCTGVGHRIGCGKESDIILVRDDTERECVLKLQRLGRCSFRTVTRNRDYKGNGRTRHGESWFYLSRLASQKEYAFMKMLYDEGFPVPKPIDQNRHALLMELVPGTLLNNITELGDAEKVYRRSLELMIKLAEQGLIHGDYNEFNLMITEDLRVIVIDFPQMVSTNHRNAAELFDRDVNNLASFFERRFKITTLWYPSLEKDVVRKGNLDKQVYASGHYTRRQEADLEAQMEAEFAKRLDGKDADGDDSDDEEEEEDSSDEQSAADCRDAGDDIDRPDCRVVAIPRESHASPSLTNPRTADTAADVHDEREGDEDSGDAKDDDEADAGSLDDEVEAARHTRTVPTANENFLPDGEIDRDHVKHQVRKNIRRKDNREFYGRLHRNAQKGRQKQTVQRELKNAGQNGFF